MLKAVLPSIIIESVFSLIIVASLILELKIVISFINPDTLFFLCNRKLHADLKTTKVEEMKVQLEMCYQEIVRLQNMKDTGMTNHARYVKYIFFLKNLIGACFFSSMKIIEEFNEINIR